MNQIILPTLLKFYCSRKTNRTLERLKVYSKFASFMLVQMLTAMPDLL